MLQNAFLMIMVRFSGNSLFAFVRLFCGIVNDRKSFIEAETLLCIIDVECVKKSIDTVCRQFLMTFILHLFLLTK
mgnify:FL=1